MKPLRLAAVLILGQLPCIAASEQIASIGVDWVGNDVVVEAIRDPDVGGVTCHLAYFSRSFLDRVSQGNWFEDPSNSAIECAQTGPIDLSGISRDSDGEDVFSEGRSLIFKSLRVKRIYDEKNQVLIYLAHAAQITEGSAKMAISSVPLFDATSGGAAK